MRAGGHFSVFFGIALAISPTAQQVGGPQLVCAEWSFLVHPQARPGEKSAEMSRFERFFASAA
jgi:hypothetical protein